MRDWNQINIKPLSVNQAFKGRRYKTNEYKKYEIDVSMMIKKEKVPDGELFIKYKFGLSNKGQDIDNCIKQFQDILSKKLGFNDNRIYRIEAEKEIVKKGKEFIKYKIYEKTH